MKGDRRSVLAVLGLLALVALAYSNSFGVPFVFDDVPSILENDSITSFSPWWRPLDPPSRFGFTVSGRPLVNLSLAINHAISGTNVWSYHVMNFLIHAAAGLVLFGLVRRTVQQPVVESSIRQHELMFSSAVAALWMAHPLQTESVTYVIQRAESLMGLCYLLTLYLFARSFASIRGRWWRSAAVVVCAAGMACKEVMVTAPVVTLLYDRTFFGGSFAAAWRARRGFYLALAATWLLLIALVASTGGDRGGTFTFTAPAFLESTRMQIEAIIVYLKLSVWPSPLIFEYGKQSVRGPAFILVCGIAAMALLIGTVWALRKRPVLGFCGAVFFLVLAPTSLLPGTTQVMVEHRMYLPLAVVVALILGMVVLRLGRTGLQVMLGFAVVAAGLTWERNGDYATARQLWTDTVEKRPSSALAQSNLGSVRFASGEWTEALKHYRESLRLDPSSAQTHYNVGLTLDALGRKEEAIASYRSAVSILSYYAQAEVRMGADLIALNRAGEAIAPLQHAAGLLLEPDEAHLLLGQAWLALDRPEEAMKSFEAALARDPKSASAEFGYALALFKARQFDASLTHLDRSLQIDAKQPEAHYQKALVRAAAGDAEGAMTSYREVLRLNPEHVEAQLNLGIMHAQRGELGEAEAQLNRAVRTRPNSPEAQANLGIVLSEQGRANEAVVHFEQALRIRPTYARAHYNLANALLRLNRLAEARDHLAQAVQLDAGLVEASDLLARVEQVLRQQ